MKIEISNLNRQILFYERIGKPKAQILNERIKEINKNITSDYYIKGFDKELISNQKYDAIFSCVDRNTARYDINKYEHDGILVSSYTHHNAIYRKLLELGYDKKMIIKFFS